MYGSGNSWADAQDDEREREARSRRRKPELFLCTGCKTFVEEHHWMYGQNCCSQCFIKGA